MRTTKSLPLSILMCKILGHKGVVNLVTRVSVTLKQLSAHGSWSGKQGLRKRTLAPRKTKILVQKHLKNKQNRTYFLLECCQSKFCICLCQGQLGDYQCICINCPRVLCFASGRILWVSFSLQISAKKRSTLIFIRSLTPSDEYKIYY